MLELTIEAALQILLELRNWHVRVFCSLVADGTYVLLNRGGIIRIDAILP
jgi:hypothetical protein